MVDENVNETGYCITKYSSIS